MVIGSVIGHHTLHVTGVKHPRKDEKTLIFALIRVSVYGFTPRFTRKMLLWTYFNRSSLLPQWDSVVA